jgi:hypothetical protein
VTLRLRPCIPNFGAKNVDEIDSREGKFDVIPVTNISILHDQISTKANKFT